MTTEATDQTFNLNLNDNIVDNMVNSYHVSTDSALETLNIRTINNIASNGDLTSRAILNLDASTLTDKSNIRLDLDSANHTIKLGDNDNIITLIGSNDDAAPKVLNSTINLGAGNDKLVIEGAMDLSNADLIGVESIEMHSTLIIKESQLDGLKDISFLFSENEHSTLAIIDDDGDGEISISSLLVAEPEDGSDNSNSTEIFDIRGVSQDGSEEADVVFNIKPAIDNSVDDIMVNDEPYSTESEGDSGYNKVELLGDTAGQEGVAEEFIYQIDSSSGDVISLVGTDVSLSGFTVGEDILTFVDVDGGTVTTETFADSVTVSASSINDVTDIYFAEDNDGNSYQLSVVGVVDETLDSMDVSVTQA